MQGGTGQEPFNRLLNSGEQAEQGDRGTGEQEEQANTGNKGTGEQGNNVNREIKGNRGRRGTGRTRRIFLKVANTNGLRFCPWNSVEC